MIYSWRRSCSLHPHILTSLHPYILTSLEKLATHNLSVRWFRSDHSLYHDSHEQLFLIHTCIFSHSVAIEKILQLSWTNMAFSEKFEHVSDIIGPWGKFQKRLFFLMIFVYIFSPFNNVGLVYYMTKADYWCTSSNGIRVSWIFFLQSLEEVSKLGVQFECDANKMRIKIKQDPKNMTFKFWKKLEAIL